MSSYKVCWYYNDDPSYSCLRLFDDLDEAVQFCYNLSSDLFRDCVSVGLYLFEVGDDSLQCLMYHEILPFLFDYKED